MGKVNLLQVESLEIHASHACNLACESCSHFSDMKIGKNVPFDEIRDGMANWSGRLKPKRFTVLGGEPALNPELSRIISECRKQWVFSELMLVSNGFHLARHEDLGSVLAATKCRLEISVHHDGEEYLEKLKPVKELTKSWKKKHGVNAYYRPSATHWRRTFVGSGKNMKPFKDGDPNASYDVCVAKRCKQILDGKIYKCPQLAYLTKYNNKYGFLDNNPEWEQYLNYRPLWPTASDEEVKQFFSLGVEPYCSMCPSHQRLFQLKNPIP